MLYYRRLCCYYHQISVLFCKQIYVFVCWCAPPRAPLFTMTYIYSSKTYFSSSCVSCLSIYLCTTYSNNDDEASIVMWCAVCWGCCCVALNCTCNTISPLLYNIVLSISIEQISIWLYSLSLSTLGIRALDTKYTHHFKIFTIVCLSLLSDL